MDRAAVLALAHAAVMGRGKSYGGPEDSFNEVARLWSVMFDRTFAAYDVALALALLKVARLKADPSHGDSIVDLAGYAACLGEITTGDGEQEEGEGEGYE